MDFPLKNPNFEQAITDKNKEILELKEKLLINNAENRMVFINEKDKFELELKSKELIIKEKNRIICELEQYKAVIRDEISLIYLISCFFKAKLPLL